MKTTKKQLLAMAVATGLAVAGTSGAAIAERPGSAEVAYTLSTTYGMPVGPSVEVGRRVGATLCGSYCAGIGAR